MKTTSDISPIRVLFINHSENYNDLQNIIKSFSTYRILSVFFSCVSRWWGNLSLINQYLVVDCFVTILLGIFQNIVLSNQNFNASLNYCTMFFFKHYIKSRHIAYCIGVQSVLKRVRTTLKLVISIMYSTMHTFWYRLMLIPSIPLLADPYACFACLFWCWLSWCWSWLKVGQCWLYTV